MHETRNPRERIEVRWGLPEDEACIAELLELNGMPRRVAAEEQFIVAERNGRVVAALQYETGAKKLVLGLLIVDPWAGEPVLANALYSKANALARELGVREAIAPSDRYRDYLYKAGYRRVIGGWSLDTARPLLHWGELAARTARVAHPAKIPGGAGPGGAGLAGEQDRVGLNTCFGD